jgi:hypothetical protein
MTGLRDPDDLRDLLERASVDAMRAFNAADRAATCGDLEGLAQILPHLACFLEEKARRVRLARWWLDGRARGDD